jgi:hypothetical protein
MVQKGCQSGSPFLKLFEYLNFYMAIYSKGILGEFSGTIGNVVGSSWRGIPVIRSKPVRKQTGSSIYQQQQRARFTLMSKFLRPLTDLLNQTFRHSAVGMTSFNKAFSRNSHAISGEYPEFRVDYSWVNLSEGRLPLGEPPVLISTVPGKLQLTWKNGDGINRRLTSGRAFIAAYNEELDRWIFSQFILDKDSSSCALDSDPFRGKQVQTYIGFISGGAHKISESRYMGVLEILP